MTNENELKVGDVEESLIDLGFIRDVYAKNPNPDNSIVRSMERAIKLIKKQSAELEAAQKEIERLKSDRIASIQPESYFDALRESHWNYYSNLLSRLFAELGVNRAGFDRGYNCGYFDGMQAIIEPVKATLKPEEG